MTSSIALHLRSDNQIQRYDLTNSLTSDLAIALVDCHHFDWKRATKFIIFIIISSIWTERRVLSTHGDQHNAITYTMQFSHELLFLILQKLLTNANSMSVTRSLPEQHSLTYEVWWKTITDWINIRKKEILQSIWWPIPMDPSTGAI